MLWQKITFTLTDFKTSVNKKENIIIKVKDNSQAGKMFPTNAGHKRDYH